MHGNSKLKPGEYMLCTEIVSDIQKIFVHNIFSLCSANRRAFYKDLPAKEVQEPPTIIPLLTYEYAAAQIAHAIPARESREISNEDPTINADRLDFSQQILNQPSSSNLTSPSIVNRKRNNKPAKCSICDASFTRKANLNLHIASVHEGKKQSFICSICDSSFTQSKNLRAHVATVHEGRKTRKCSICNKRFAYSRDLKRHIARIHKEV
jgi:uncharacterized Zn-finger protein